MSALQKMGVSSSWSRTPAFHAGDAAVCSCNMSRRLRRSKELCEQSLYSLSSPWRTPLRLHSQRFGIEPYRFRSSKNSEGAENVFRITLPCPRCSEDRDHKKKIIRTDCTLTKEWIKITIRNGCYRPCCDWKPLRKIYLIPRGGKR